MDKAGDKIIEKFEAFNSTVDDTYSALSDGANKVSSSMERATESTDYWTDAIGSYDKEAMEAVYSTEELVNMGYKTEDALEEAAKAADKATEEIADYGKKSEEAGGKSEKFGEKSKEAITSLNDVLTTAGVAVAIKEITEAFAECSEKASEFEVNVAKITTVADTSVRSASQLSEGISALSMDVAKSVNELAEAEYDAISSSIETADAIDFVDTANKLAVSGFTDSATAVDVLTTSINAYGMQASEASMISDYLITTQNLGKTTVDELSKSLGMVIPTAAAYAVELDNLSTGYSVLTSNGVATAQSTTYLKSMLSELADTGSTVAGILLDETGRSFTELNEDGYSLGDVMQILGDSVGGNATAFSNLWNSIEAGTGALSLYNSGAEKFNAYLDEMRNSVGATAKAYEVMTNTTDYSTQRMENSFNNLSIAIGEDLNPTISDLQNDIADVTDKFTKMIHDNPAISAALTGVTLAISAATVALVGYKVAMTVATLATTAWTAVLDMNPVFLAITAIGALTAGVVAFSAILGDSTDESDNWIESARIQHEELQELNKEYDEAIDKYGETSEEALRLRYQVDELKESFESNKQTVDEFVAECENLISTNQEIMKSYDDNMNSIHTNEISTMALIQRLSDLAKSTDQTAGSQMEMEAIIEDLNESVEGLSLSYDDLIVNQDSAIESLKAMAQAQAEQEKYQEQYDTYVKALKSAAALESEIAKATDEKTAAQERYNAAEEAYSEKLLLLSKYDTSGMAGLSMMFSDEKKELDKASESLEKYSAQLEGVQKDYDAAIDQQEEITSSWEKMTSTAEETVSAEEAVATATEGVSDKLKELATAYEDAYSSAKDSIDGQIGLFDTMKTETELSISDMQKAMESQYEYITNYTDNLKKAAEFGLDTDLISALSDGSTESAGQLDAIISKIEKLGGTTEGMSDDAKKFIDNFNSSFTKVEDAKDTFATTVAEMETSFSSGMDTIGEELATAIDGMNMSNEAAEAAKSTMDAYIDGIKSKTGELNSALASIDWANANMSKFSTTGLHEGWAAFADPYASLPSVDELTKRWSIPHAEGGIFDTPHYGVFAEEGPESFIPIDGSERSYNIWEDTGRLIGALPEDDTEGISLPVSENTDNRPGTSERSITLKIEGAGSLKVDGRLSKESILDTLTENLRPILIDIMEEEILNSGDASYEW